MRCFPAAYARLDSYSEGGTNHTASALNIGTQAQDAVAR
jgi:hypothetical protein